MDRFARVRGDTRLRATADGRSSVAVVAKAEPLSPLPPTPYPVIVTEAADRVTPSVGVLPRQPLLGAPELADRCR